MDALLVLIFLDAILKELKSGVVGQIGTKIHKALYLVITE